MNTIRIRRKLGKPQGFMLGAALIALLSFGSTTFAAPAASEPLPRKAAEAGDRFSLILKKDGSLWAWGQNSNKLGMGSNANTIYEKPVKVTGISEVAAISTGAYHTLAVKSDGTVWAWGENGGGALGIGSEPREVNVPHQVKGPGGEGFLTDVVDVAVGDTYSLALKQDGTVWQWGTLHTFQSATPVPVTGEQGLGVLSGIAKIDAGQDFALALKNDGSVLQWGNSFYILSAPSMVPQKVQGLDQVKAIGHGNYHALAVRAEGTVWAWGANFSGMLGDGSKSDSLTPVQVKLPGGEPLQQVQAVTGANLTSYAIKEDGTVWSWGDSNNGMLGIGELTEDTYFGSPYALQVKGEDGIGSLSQVASLSGSEAWSNLILASKTDGTFSGWGKNGEKQLVNTAIDTYTVPVKLDIRDDATDTTPPSPVSFIPAQGAVNVTVDAAVKVTFDEAIADGPALSSIVITDSSGAPVSGVTTAVQDRELQIEHAAFTPQQAYTVKIPAQAVKDTAGNANAAEIKWTFTTAGAPVKSAQPLADKLSFRSDSLTGQPGAVAGAAVVKAYKLPAKQELLGTAAADPSGAFQLAIPDPSAAVQTVYVTATEDGKAESDPTAVIRKPVSPADVFLHLPGGGTVSENQTLEVEVQVANYADLYGAQLQIKFDPAKLKLADSLPIQVGDLWNGHSAALFLNQDPARLQQGILTFAGTLRGEATGLQGSQPTSIVKIRFVAIGAPGKTAIELPVDGVKLAALPRGTSALPIPAHTAGSGDISIIPGPSAGKATVSLAASAHEVQAGQPFTVRVNADEYKGVYGAQFQLTYDPARLTVQDEDPAKPGVQVRAGSLFGTAVTQQVYNLVDTSQGLITFASMLRVGTSGVSGSEPASIAEITFIPIADLTGDTRIALKAGQVKLAGYPSGGPANWQLPVELADHTVTVKVNPARPDTQAPVWPPDASLTASGVTSSAVTLKWTPATDDIAVSSYKIWKETWSNASVTDSVYGGGAGLSVAEAVYVKQEAALVPGTQTEWTLSELESGTAYRFTVEAGDLAGHWSTGGPAVTVTTPPGSGSPDKEAPRWPQGARLEATSIGVNEVNLKWPTATDNTAVTAYRLYRGTTLIATVTDTVYKVSGLSSDTSYIFAVIAGDAAGNWSDKLERSFTTDRYSSGSGSGSCCGASTPPTTFPSTENGIVLPKTYLRTTKETLAGGALSTLVTVDEEALGKALSQLKNAAASAQRITISVEPAEPTVRLQLPASILLKSAADTPKAVILLEAGAVRYELPVGQISYEAIAKKLGADSKQVKLTLTASALTGTALEQLKGRLKGMSLLSDAVEFTVTAEGGGQSQVIDRFNGTMVKRMFVISEQDANQLTGVRFEQNGPVFVPTVIQTIGGKRVAVLMSPTNSAYGVVKYRKTFLDTEGHWAQADIELLASKLVVQGTAEDRFTPDTNVTRAEFASLLVRSLGLPVHQADVPFKDVRTGDWFYDTVGTAVNAGLIEGFEDGTFQPGATITREQMAVMIARALKTAGSAPKAGHAGALDAFRDQNAVSAWAKEALSLSVDLGLMNGMTDSTIEPANHATRAQAAVILKRLLRYAGYIH
ncbi:S-layer homology domain-containing protein [Paenibacillus filicis]|uniref:S-layer homology domain-containing protein n=1 Tax=Paenibacillus filicis TaxID=669464 RepID=A0ABU9DGE7_9BACL